MNSLLSNDVSHIKMNYNTDETGYGKERGGKKAQEENLPQQTFIYL
jgi:hypothetical protein